MKKNSFNFAKEIPLNFFNFSPKGSILQKKSLNFFFFRNKKISFSKTRSSLAWTVKLETIFLKTLSKRVFLKILENFSNFSKISNPQENCCALFYTYVVVTPNPPPLTYLKLKKIKGPKMDSLHFTFFHFSQELRTTNGSLIMIINTHSLNLDQHSTPSP